MIPHYSFNVTWSDTDAGYIAVSPELGGISGFGDTPETAVAELRVAIELAIETYREEGWTLPDPSHLEAYSGQFRLRLSRSLHKALADQATHEHVSLNALATTLIAEGLGHAQAYSTATNDYVFILRQWKDMLSLFGETIVEFRQQASEHSEFQDPLLNSIHADNVTARSTG